MSYQPLDFELAQHLASRREPVEIAQLLLEASIERLHETVLPRGCHIADRDVHPALFEVIGALLGHEFRALVGVKDRRSLTGCKSLAQSR